MHGHDLAAAALLEFISDGILDQLRSCTLGLVGMYVARIHGADRADGHAVTVATARGTTVIRLGIGRVGLVDEMISRGSESLSQAIGEVGPGPRRHRIGFGALRKWASTLTALIIPVASRNAESFLGALIPGLQILIFDRPVATY